MLGAKGRTKARSLLGLTAIQHLKRVNGAAGLTPKCCFIAVEPIEREIRQVGQSQETAGKLDGCAARFHPTVQLASCRRTDRVLRRSVRSEVLRLIAETFCVNLEKSSFHRYRAAQPPK